MLSLPCIGILAVLSCWLSEGRSEVVLGGGKVLREARARPHKRQVINELPVSTLTAAEKQELLDLHLEYRENVTGAGNMLLMGYAEDLASLAQETANTCRFENTDARFPDNGTDVGQIIFRAGGTDSPVEPLKTLFKSEADNYDYDSNTCQTGQTCDNYKQVIWYNSVLMGCGKNFCPLLIDPDSPVPLFSSWFWVCTYYEPATTAHPYLPSAEPCSLCNLYPGTTCTRNMCAECDPTSDLNCRAQDELACVEDLDECCPNWDANTYCIPGTKYYPYMSTNCASHCGVTYCGRV